MSLRSHHFDILWIRCVLIPLTSLGKAVAESHLQTGRVFVEEFAARNGHRGVPDASSPHSSHLAARQLLPDRRIEPSF